MTIKNGLTLLICLSAPLLIGSIGGIATASNINTWYALLNKPSFNPPNYLFGPVWTLLYTFMAIAAYLVWRRVQFNKKGHAFWHVYWTQLILNTLWSILFFGLKFTGLAFIEIIAMWYFILRSIEEGAKIDKWSAYLLYPYLAWVSFASLLNLAIWFLN